MAKLGKVYRCKHCGNIVTVLHEGDGTLVCCGEAMRLLEEKTAKQEGKEKHVPVIEQTTRGIKVKIGSVEHPMNQEHYIEFVQVIADNETHTKQLKSGQKPEVVFPLIAKNIQVRAYCNLHGLWRS
jgi:superoxide reductase